MKEAMTGFFLLVGALFTLLAAVGLVRLPDLFTRMQATTKASTLGVGCLLLSVAIYFGELGVTARALATITFIFLTAPVAAHMIGRAAYIAGVSLWESSVADELRDRYDPETHALSSGPRPAVPSSEENPATEP